MAMFSEAASGNVSQHNIFKNFLCDHCCAKHDVSIYPTSGNAFECINLLTPFKQINSPQPLPY
jgi:hypothetical protein